MPTLARVSRGSSDRYQWAPIRDTSPLSPNFRDSSHASALRVSSGRPRARLSRPPNLPFGLPSPLELSPPISPLPEGYVAPKGLQNSQHTSLVVQHTLVRQLSLASLNDTFPGTSPTRNFARLDGARTGEVARQPTLKNRISTVSQYPVFVSSDSRCPSMDSRMRTRRRPISIASTSTTGIYLAVGALPGSEPFDLDPPSQDVLNRHDGFAASTEASMHPRPYVTVDTSTYQPMSTIQGLTGLRGDFVSSSLDAPDSRISFISSDSALGSSPRRNFSLSGSPRSIHRPSVQATYSWPEDRPEESFFQDERRVQWNPRVVTSPPMPPPKDYGYISRPPSRAARRLRVCTSTPHLPSIISPPAMEREGIIKEQSGVGYERSPGGRNNWFSSLSRRTQNRPRSQSRLSNKHVGVEERSNNVRSQLLVAWTRFKGRAISKVPFHNKGS